MLDAKRREKETTKGGIIAMHCTVRLPGLASTLLYQVSDSVDRPAPTLVR